MISDIDSLKHLNELTEMLPAFPTGDPPPIPEEWLRARGLRQPEPKEKEVRDE